MSDHTKEIMLGLFVVIIGCLIALFVYHPQTNQNTGFGDAGQINFFNTPTAATSSAGIYSSTLALARDTSRQFASFCNPSPTSTNFITLQLNATTTDQGGILIAGNSCYSMSPTVGNLFTDNVYARASTSTTTLMILSK